MRKTTTSCRRRPLFRPAQPGILPRRRDILVVSPKLNIGAVAVGEFQSLVFADWHLDCAPYAGVRLIGDRVLYTVHTCCPAEPEIAIERGPQPLLLEVVAQVPFEGPNWALRLVSGARKEGVARKEFGIRGEEPHSEVPIEYPFAPTLGIAKFWFEGPAVSAPVDQLRRVVLAGWSHDLETGAQQELLLPFHELLHRHGRAAFQVYGDAKDRIEETGTVSLLLCVFYCPLEVTKCVRQRSEDVGRAAKKAERVIVAEDRYAICSRGTDGEWAKVKAAVVVIIRQSNRIGMHWGDEVGTRSKVLRPAGMYGHSSKNRQNQQSWRNCHLSYRVSLTARQIAHLPCVPGEPPDALSCRKSRRTAVSIYSQDRESRTGKTHREVDKTCERLFWDRGGKPVQLNTGCECVECSLHYRRHGDSHHAQQVDQFAADDSGGCQQEFFPARVGFGEDVMAVVEVVELLRELEGVFSRKGRFGRCNALLDDERGLSRQQPQLPDFGAALVGEIACVIHCGGERLLGINAGFAKDVCRTHHCILRVGSGLAFEGQGLMEVEGDDRLLGKLQHEIAQRADSNSFADKHALVLVAVRMAAVHFTLGRGNQRVEQVVCLHAESLATRDLDVRFAAIFLANLVAQLHGAARRERDHLIGEMSVVRSLLRIAEQPDGLDDGVLRIALPRVDHVVDGCHAAKMRMVSLAVLGRDPHIMPVGIAIEPAIAEVAPEEAELPQVVGDVLADIANRAIRAHDYLRVLVGTGFLFCGLWGRS